MPTLRVGWGGVEWEWRKRDTERYGTEREVENSNSNSGEGLAGNDGDEIGTTTEWSSEGRNGIVGGVE